LFLLKFTLKMFIIIIIIIIISHDLGFDRPDPASSNSFKGLQNRLRPVGSIIQHCLWHPVVHSCYIS